MSEQPDNIFADFDFGDGWDTIRGSSFSIYADYLDKNVLIVKPSGEIGITQKLMENLGNPEQVYLVYNSEKKAVAIKAAENANSRTSRVVYGDRNKIATIVSAKRFTRETGMVAKPGTKISKIWKGEWDAERKILVISLFQTPEEVTVR